MQHLVASVARPRTAAGTPRPGGRTARNRTAIFEATVLELGKSGYAELSVDAIAARAGVHKTTIYRRWRSRDELVAAALVELASQQLEVVETGNIDRDARVLARSVARILSQASGAAVVRAMVTATQPDGRPAIISQFWASRLQAVRPMLDRAVQAGQLPRGTDPAQVIGAIAAPLYFRLLVSSEPVTQRAADAAAAAALAAARAGVFSPHRTARRTDR
jgi:AcrR family transcriptional regulator